MGQRITGDENFNPGVILSIRLSGQEQRITLLVVRNEGVLLVLFWEEVVFSASQNILSLVALKRNGGGCAGEIFAEIWFCLQLRVVFFFPR